MKNYLLSVLLCFSAFAQAGSNDSSFDDVDVVHVDEVGNVLDDATEGDAAKKYCIVTITNQASLAVEVRTGWREPALDRTTIRPGKTKCWKYYGCIRKRKLRLRHQVFPKEKPGENTDWKHWKLRSNKTQHSACEDGRQYVFRDNGKDRVKLFRK